MEDESVATKIEDQPEVAAMLAAARTLSVTDFESAKAHLMREGPDGSCAYDHLVEVVAQSLAGGGAPAASLRQTSRAALAAAYVGRRAAPALAAEEAAAAAEKQWASASVGLATSAAAEAAVQNISALADLLGWAGVALSREDAHRLYAQMKSIASTMNDLDGMRFWGKISATESDYFVIEAEIAAAAPDVDFEGTLGPSKFTYLVSGCIGGPWATLPSVSAAQIVAAGKVRRGFTGRLDAVVGGHPVFPDAEASYLRARIALITAATAISPAGSFVARGEEGADAYTVLPWAVAAARKAAAAAAEGEEAEEAAGPEAQDAESLKDAGSWQHHVLPLNALGRSTPIPGDEVEQPDAVLPLQGASEDESITVGGVEGIAAWSARVCPAAAPPSVPGRVAVLRSQVWPGAVAVASGLRWACAYFGNGLPELGVPYMPEVPTRIASEDFEARVEQVDNFAAPAVEEEEDGE